MLKWFWILPGPEYERNFRTSVFNSNSVPKISTYQVCFCIKIWANIVAGNRCIQICLSCQVFFCNADFTLYACFFLAGYHLKCFGDGCISAGDVFEKEEEDGISDCWIGGGCLLIRGMRKWLGGKIPCISITRHCWRRRYIILSCGFPTHRQCLLCCKVLIFSKACDDRIATRLSC